ncbi:OLC1v1033081C2 [Oldenlandia corymbosa var. corymbosa]|uniref:OLC1v1033081C2 n=1 Tax=Oldenlandia corymbosa var. corymbosa TaxID=529605 RepID=A0AAV1CMQ7_OLDCO|nr:OLC1v1033081C2 [Oldenlandia corymbosa var. corymbosa]
MILKSNPTSTSQNCLVSSPLFCPCNKDLRVSLFSNNFPLKRRNGRTCDWNSISSRRNWIIFKGCISGGGGGPGTGRHHSLRARDVSSSARVIVLKRFPEDPELEESSANSSSRDFSTSSSNNNHNFVGFEEDPFVDKLRTQLGVIHPLPSPRINRNIVGLFVFFFFVGVVFDKLWTSRKKNNSDTSRNDGKFGGLWRSQVQMPASLSTFLEKDLQRKESVEWVNMVLGKLWKVYRGGLENWIIGLLQPVIDNLKKPDYVERVEIKQFSLGDEPLSVRSVERKTSRRANDLQYQIGLRYTGGARMLLLLSLKFGLLPIAVPVGVRDFDIDGELWVKLRLIPTVPWVGAVSWAFVSLPKIKVELSPFRLFNLMTIPVLSMFLKKLLTEDLPKLFVRPKKIVLDFEKGKAVGPVANDIKPGEVQEGNKDYTGELSVTLVDAQKLSYFYGKTDPYVILFLGDQVIRSKKNSQTTVIGPPGAPIWNQDFHLLVENPRKQKLFIEVKDSLGFTEFTVGTAEIDLGSLEDTVPTDRIVSLRGGWTQFGKSSAGELLLRLTYKAYVEDEEDERTEPNLQDKYASDDELDAAIYEQNGVDSSSSSEKESFMDVLAALIVSEEFLGIVASEAGVAKPLNNSKNASDSRLTGTTIGSVRQASVSDSENSDGGSGNFRGSALLWLAVVTSISVLIAMNMGGSSIFNP